ncbi:MAG TPA: hypothetical protein VJQ82_21665 [Terriglobales bacterium]|nr:hypothetical protein [Terriglobales bacterium]
MYAELNTTTAGPVEVIVNSQLGDSFTFSGAVGADPGAASTTVVVGSVGQYINPNNGSGLDGVIDGTTYSRTLAGWVANGVPYNFQGAWSAITSYVKGAEVSSGGNYWLAIAPNTNQDYALDGTNYLRMPAPPSTSASSSGGTLTQTGTGAQFTVSAITYYLGNLTMSVNAGTVNPGSYNTFYVYFDSPNYAGGSLAFQVTTDPSILGQYPWRFYVGTITTTPSGGGSGGGGNRGPCFTGDVRIKTSGGYRRFDELPDEFEIENHTGRHRARLIVHLQSLEPMRRMGDGLVTVGHLIRVGGGWVPAGEIFHERALAIPRTVYNVHVISDSPEDHHYLLENGLTAHNIKQ